MDNLEAPTSFFSLENRLARHAEFSYNTSRFFKDNHLFLDVSQLQYSNGRITCEEVDYFCVRLYFQSLMDAWQQEFVDGNTPYEPGDPVRWWKIIKLPIIRIFGRLLKGLRDMVDNNYIQHGNLRNGIAITDNGDVKIYGMINNTSIGSQNPRTDLMEVVSHLEYIIKIGLRGQNMDDKLVCDDRVATFILTYTNYKNNGDPFNLHTNRLKALYDFDYFWDYGQKKLSSHIRNWKAKIESLRRIVNKDDVQTEVLRIYNYSVNRQTGMSHYKKGIEIVKFIRNVYSHCEGMEIQLGLVDMWMVKEFPTLLQELRVEVANAAYLNNVAAANNGMRNGANDMMGRLLSDKVNPMIISWKLRPVIEHI
ncbi:hypothetical protein ACFE04_021697 [Oxalis oulophora]